MSLISKEIMLDRQGNTIGTKELHTEIFIRGILKECVTKEIIKLLDGKIVFDHVIYRTQWNKHESSSPQGSEAEQTK